ncbi:MAG: class I SAM-dependent methyltransferase [Chlorobiaceae bacterium]|jgi:2-polyprenyl-3-methyl-5-hydroxy-6-metoxy-1,4-benzoquinol methylase
METVPCPISNSIEFTPWLQVPDRFDSSGKTRWKLVQSCASGLIMLNPRPDSSEIAVHYRNGQYDPYLHKNSSSSLGERAYLAARSLLLRYRASLILNGAFKPFHKLSILEIGCSTGELLNFFHRSRGVPLDHLAGVEPDADSAAYAREVFGLRVSPLLQEGAEKFDRIVLWHTLEHIHAINETLHAVSSLLEPDGVLVLALPNPASSGANYYRENWIAWDAPRHLFHFMPGTLEKLLEQHHLRVFRRKPYFPDALYNTFYSEQLRCKSQGGRFNLRQQGIALGWAMVSLDKEALWPKKASSFIYFARKT